MAEGYLRAVRLERDKVPDFTIYPFAIPSIRERAYEGTEHYTITRDFLSSPERSFKQLFRR